MRHPLNTKPEPCFLPRCYHILVDNCVESGRVYAASTEYKTRALLIPRCYHILVDNCVESRWVYAASTEYKTRALLIPRCYHILVDNCVESRRVYAASTEYKTRAMLTSLLPYFRRGPGRQYVNVGQVYVPIATQVETIDKNNSLFPSLLIKRK